MPGEHALLSLSGSARWLLCSGSIEAESHYESTSSLFANEGILAHEVAAECLNFALREKVEFVDISDGSIYKVVEEHLAEQLRIDRINTEMLEVVNEYVDYVFNLMTSDSELFVEQKVNLQIPESWGTLDAAVFDYESGVCHVIDLKYGKGVKVSPYDNTQFQLYACGAHHTLDQFDEFDQFRLHVVQPRIFNINYWDIDLEQLVEFEKYAYEQAAKALSKNAVRTPGEIQCRWCRAKSDCNALANFAEKALTVKFDNLDEVGAVLDIANERMSDEQKRFILDNKSLIESFLKAVWDETDNRLRCGKKFSGYKLVEQLGRNGWAKDAESFLLEELGDKAYQKQEKKLITITNAKKALNRNDVETHLVKSDSKIVMVPETDNRQSVMLKDDKIVKFEKLD